MKKRWLLIPLLFLIAIVGLFLAQKEAFAMVIEWGGNPDATSTTQTNKRFFQPFFSNTEWYETTTTISVYLTNLTGGYPPVEPLGILYLGDKNLATGVADFAIAGGQTKFITFTFTPQQMADVLAAGWNNPTSTRFLGITNFIDITFHAGNTNGTLTSFCPPDYFGWSPTPNFVPSERVADDNIGCAYYIVQIGQTWIPPSLPSALISSSTPQIQITCNPGDPWYQYSLCKLAIWLSIPSQQDLTNFMGLIDFIKMKPPIGYFYVVQNALGGLNSSTTPVVNLYFGTISDYFFTPIRTGLIFIIWLGFGIWVYHRVKHLEL